MSDLVVGPSARVSNSSAFLLGLLSLVATYFLRQSPNFKTVSILLLLMAIGAIGVGVFTKDFTLAHGAVSSMASFFGGLYALASFKVLESPFL
jgi:hypothetical membrane protein